MTLSIRPFTAADEAAVVELYRRTYQDDPTVGAISIAGWRHFASMSHNQGGRDFRAAWAGDGARERLVGVATTSQRAHAEPWIRHFRIVVEPAWRRRGVGGALLRALAELDAPHAVLMQTLCPEDWLAGAAFLEAAGFAPIELEIDMECAALIAPARPGNWVIRRVAEPRALAEPVAALHNRAYAGTPSFVQLDAGEMAELLGEGELWVAESGGDLVAICHLEPEGAKLRLESLAVEPVWQGRGAGPRAHRGGRERGARRLPFGFGQESAGAARLRAAWLPRGVLLDALSRRSPARAGRRLVAPAPHSLRDGRQATGADSAAAPALALAEVTQLRPFRFDA